MAETIKEHSAINMYEMDQSKYAIVVDRRRALPEVRDGLKPVQRRVVYGAFFDGLNSPSKKDKSSALVGLVMRRLHAHGDCIRGNTKFCTYIPGFARCSNNQQRPKAIQRVRVR